MASAARFAAPAAAAYDGADTVYLADAGNHSVRRVDVQRQEVQTLAGDGTPGLSDGLGTAARFSSPAGLTLDRERWSWPTAATAACAGSSRDV